MDAIELALALCEIRERTAGDAEAYDAAAARLAELLGEQDNDEGEISVLMARPRRLDRPAG